MHNIIVEPPAAPDITEISANSTSITITWEQDLSSDVLWYELQYNFTIRECENNNNTVNTGIILIDGHLRNYTLGNNTGTAVEEDSTSIISVTAVNSAGKSEASTYRGATLRASKLD